MYQRHFGLQRRPFPATPDSCSYYPATSHEQALAALLGAIEMGDGLFMLTGETGTGKTLLCHCLLERLPSDCGVAFLTNSHVETNRELLQTILYDLSLPYENGTAGELRLRLTDFLLQQFAEGRRTLFIIDEAHHLTVDALEELRLLGNLEAGQRKAVQVLLVAGPALLTTLKERKLEALAQRMIVRARLDPLDLEEAIDYVIHQIRIAGGKPEALFTDEALEILAKQARGIPRLLNQLGHQSLLLCDQLELDQVDVEVALEVLSALGLALELPQEELPDAVTVDETPETTPQIPEQDVLSYRLFDPPRRPA